MQGLSTRIVSFVGLASAILAIAFSGYIVLTYRDIIKRHVEEIASLKAELKEVQTVLAGIVSDGGIQGPKGDTGPQGPIGPAGSTAGGVTENQVRELIREALVGRQEEVTVSSGIKNGTVAECFKPGLRTAPRFEFGPNFRFCDNEGKVYATVTRFEGSGVRFETSRGEARWCTIGGSCSMRANEIFFIDEIISSGPENIAKARFF